MLTAGIEPGTRIHENRRLQQRGIIPKRGGKVGWGNNYNQFIYLKKTSNYQVLIVEWQRYLTSNILVHGSNLLNYIFFF